MAGITGETEATAEAVIKILPDLAADLEMNAHNGPLEGLEGMGFRRAGRPALEVYRGEDGRLAAIRVYDPAFARTWKLPRAAP